MSNRRESATHSSLAPQQHSYLESVFGQTATTTSLMNSRLAQFPPLEQVTKPNFKTEEAAFYLNRRPQTLRAWACLENGPIRPRRIGGLLAWATADVKTLCGVA